MKLDSDTVYTTFRRALRDHGMNQAQADSAARVFLDAELAGKPSHGAFHLLTYLEALDSGSLNGDASPTAQARGSVLRIDADEGMAQFALEHHAEELLAIAHTQGVAVAAVRNTYTTGELGWYPRFFSRHGLVSLTTTNSPALVALSGSGERVVGTNPLSFGVPDAMTVDQAVSPAAFHRVRQYAERGKPLPEGWAVDADGSPTTDARTAVEEGALVPMGGARGGNLALIREMLAMLAGGESSLGATARGEASPAVGLFCVVMDPSFFGEDTIDRMRGHLNKLRTDYGVYVPGRTATTEIDIDEETWGKLVG